MQCTNCGRKIKDDSCAFCGRHNPSAPPFQGELPQNHNNEHNLQNIEPQASGKNVVAAGLLAILLGYGVHCFYLGHIKKAIIQLSMWVVSLVLLTVGAVMLIIEAGRYTDSSSMLVIGIIALSLGGAILIAVRIWELVDGVNLLCNNIKVDGNQKSLLQINGKSKIVAGVLAIVLGSGIYNFYLKFTAKAVIQLLITLASIILITVGTVLLVLSLSVYHSLDLFIASLAILISGSLFLPMRIWEILEGIMLLTGSIEVDGNGIRLV